MSRIRGCDTKPELLLRRQLWARGLRYRLKSRLPGKPDLVFVSVRVAIFVDGCQWHCCPKHFVRPRSNQEFWDLKFSKNRERDKAVNARLREEGWCVLRFWEHDVESKLDAVISMILDTVQSRSSRS